MNFGGHVYQRRRIVGALRSTCPAFLSEQTNNGMGVPNMSKGGRGTPTVSRTTELRGRTYQMENSQWRQLAFEVLVSASLRG